MFQSADRLWIHLIIVISCFSILCWPTDVFAEQSVYDTYTKDNGQVTDDDGMELEGLPSEQESDLIGLSDNKQTGIWLILKTIFYLLIILAMIYGLIKFLAMKQNKLGRHQLFKHIGGTSLGSNKSLQLIKMGQTYFLIGVAEQINLIKEITDPTEIALIEEEIEKQESFITKGIGSFISFKEEPNKTEVSSSFQHMLTSSLEKQKRKRESVESKWNMSGDE